MVTKIDNRGLVVGGPLRIKGLQERVWIVQWPRDKENPNAIEESNLTLVQSGNKSELQLER